jgi:zinc finger CCHC domain-containing protein 9
LLAVSLSVLSHEQADATAATVFLGGGHEAGADEDDFHIFRRKNTEVDREIQGEERVRKMAHVREGKHSGIVKAFGAAPQAKPKKVVNF